MKAMICRRWGGPEDLRLEDLEQPPLKPGQVRIKVRAAGVSFATTLVIAGKDQRRPPVPFAPGTEASGTVTEVDPACRRLKVGDEVVAVLDWGGLAEEAVAHEVNVFPKPKNLGFVEAIQLAISYPTSAGALTWPMALDVQRGQTLLVHAAAGGVGMAAVEIGKILGATVIATAGGARKTAFARAHGADHVIDYTAADFREEVLKLTNGRGVDRVYDPVGGDVFAQSLRCMAVEGRICPIGFAGGTIPSIPANILLVKTIAVTGWLRLLCRLEPACALQEAGRTFALMERIRGWCEAGHCRPHVDRTFRLDQAADAMRALLERSVTGRVAIVME
jgi:NADPH2:quinone reductase